ncbi:hypothetical protein FGO68_gene17500 [Halteria grandinella]|uniref:Malate dehydrogenase n=1 Tax=Halteria grandinella TaxID=5974 RepID=A0A8J8T0I2_HALGN|nr:hypothetical protein FGO68_gene17500 [Halteria grandinella]
MATAPKCIVVTGAHESIAYATVFRIASGQLLGPNQRVIIHMLDDNYYQDVLLGVTNELRDCAFPLLDDVVYTSELPVAYKDVDYAFHIYSDTVGVKMNDDDIIKYNGTLFEKTGKAMNDYAKRDCKSIVIGDPANTNALVLAHSCPGIPRENFTAMTRLDHNRALAQLALKTGSIDISCLAIWGNHSATMYPDIRNTTVAGKKATNLVDAQWVNDEFIPRVQNRSDEINKLRGGLYSEQSSAASTSNAAIAHMRDWVLGSNEWQSVAVYSDGKAYGVPEGLIFSMPVTSANGKFSLVKGLDFDDAESVAKIKKTTEELLDQRKLIEDLLK